MAKRRVMVMVGAGALVLGACGGDDDSGAGSGNVDDAVSDLIEDIADGDIEGLAEDIANGDVDPEAVVESAQDAAQDMIDDLGMGGSGQVDLDGESIEFTAEFCAAFEDDFDFSGPGSTADGQDVWVELGRLTETREELLEFFDESMLEQLYGDADPIVIDSFRLDFGRTGLFESGPDDQASLSVDATPGEFQGLGTLEMDVDGSSATGSGEAPDLNLVLTDQFDELVPFSFSVSCS